MLLALFCASSLFAATVPALSGRVNDYASMISPQTRAIIDAKLRALEQSDSTQVAILTVPSLEGEPIEDYSIKVVEAWKIGRKGKDNGVLLIVSKNDRKIRIEVGYGLEGRLTDLQSGRIIREIIKPAFLRGDFDAGFIAGTDAIVAAVKGEFTAPASKKKSREEPGPSFPLVIVILVVLFMLIRIFRFFGGGPPGFGGFGGPGGGGFFPGEGPGKGGDSGDDGGFSGGGGGFGGGGASDNW
jgi:uncharacterized protein